MISSCLHPASQLCVEHGAGFPVGGVEGEGVLEDVVGEAVLSGLQVAVQGRAVVRAQIDAARCARLVWR